MFGSNVAPKRKVNDKKSVPWSCKCSSSVHEDYAKTNPGYLVRCTDCKTERP